MVQNLNIKVKYSNLTRIEVKVDDYFHSTKWTSCTMSLYLPLHPSGVLTSYNFVTVNTPSFPTTTQIINPVLFTFV